MFARWPSPLLSAPGPGDRGAGPFVYLDLEVPLALHAAVARHHDHLTRLLASLRDAGIGEGAVRASVDALIAIYRAELAAAIAALSLETSHG